MKRKPQTQPTGFPGKADNRMKTPKPDVSMVTVDHALALRVKAVYVSERKRWESMKSGENVDYTPPRSYDGVSAITIEDEVVLEPAKPSAWAKIVLWCQARKINPEEFVRTCFYCLPLKHTAPEPRQLLGDTYWQKWVEYSAIMPRQLAEDLERQRKLARAKIITEMNLYKRDEATAYDNVLTDSHVALSPLFRYCLATALKTKRGDEIAGVFQAEAVIQFYAYRELYCAAWHSALPEGFPQLAEKLYPVVITAQGVAMRKDESNGQ